MYKARAVITNLISDADNVSLCDFLIVRAFLWRTSTRCWKGSVEVIHFTSRVIEKLTVPLLVKKFAAFYGTVHEGSLQRQLILLARPTALCT